MRSRSRTRSYDASHHDEIVVGMATIFWASAWADHVDDDEGHHCVSLSGVEITSVMPPIPAEAFALAERCLGGIEQASGVGWPVLWRQACEADAGHALDETPDTTRGDGIARFGECLAYEAMGDGVCWADDHEVSAEYPPVVPYDAGEISCELREIAMVRCEEK